MQKNKVQKWKKIVGIPEKNIWEGADLVRQSY